MSSSRSLLILAFALAACAAPSLPADDTTTDTPSITGSGSKVPATSSCTGENEGCACSSTAAPIACFSGPAELRGKNGCQDGKRTCTTRGEFSVWGPCVGEITSCSASAATDGGADAASDSGASSTPPVVLPDYNGCTALPAYGRRGYGQCSPSQVVVIVNDGDEEQMTCCPVGANVLSSIPGEQQVPRTGLCLTDEVATGMWDPKAGVFCTKVNPALKVTLASTAQYVEHGYPGVLGQIASSYNNNDTCICDTGTVVVGGHLPKNDQCGDRCARIEKK